MGKYLFCLDIQNTKEAALGWIDNPNTEHKLLGLLTQNSRYWDAVPKQLNVLQWVSFLLFYPTFTTSPDNWLVSKYLMKMWCTAQSIAVHYHAAMAHPEWDSGLDNFSSHKPVSQTWPTVLGWNLEWRTLSYVKAPHPSPLLGTVLGAVWLTPVVVLLGAFHLNHSSIQTLVSSTHHSASPTSEWEQWSRWKTWPHPQLSSIHSCSCSFQQSSRWTWCDTLGTYKNSQQAKETNHSVIHNVPPPFIPQYSEGGTWSWEIQQRGLRP